MALPIWMAESLLLISLILCFTIKLLSQSVFVYI